MHNQPTAQRYKTLLSFLGVLAISFVGSLVSTYLACRSCRSDFSQFTRISLWSSFIWAALWLGNAELGHFVTKKISWVEFPLRRLIVGIISTVIYTVSIVILIIKVSEYFLFLRFDDYSKIIFQSLVITFLISLFLHGREFLISWKASAVNSERLQKESVRAQYESLKNQVNPHFLFNSLNALTNLVYQDQDKAAKFIKQLSEVYRYVLDSRDKELVPLQEELQFLESYIYLQQIRFGDKLKMIIELPAAQGQVAPLALQLLIENAIKHNIIAEDQPLTVRVYQQEGYIIVENNLQKKTVLNEDSSGLGLENIKRRYEFLSALKVKVKESGLVFKVEIPIITP